MVKAELIWQMVPGDNAVGCVGAILTGLHAFVVCVGLMLILREEGLTPNQLNFLTAIFMH